MASNLKPISVKQYLVILGGSTKAYFNSCKGGKQSRQEEEYNDGQTGQTFSHLGFVKNDKLTITKNFDPTADKVLLDWVNTRMSKDGNARFPLTVQPVQVDLAGTVISGAGTFQFLNCQLVSWMKPDSDRDGSGMSKLELEICFDSWSYQ